MMGSVTTRLILYLVGSLAIAGGLTAGYLGWRTHERNIGWNGALAAVAAQNAQARQAVANVNATIDKCEAEGGGWNVSTGTCDR
jgi:hypothetical protein